jgi:hypothetical protein
MDCLGARFNVSGDNLLRKTQFLISSITSRFPAQMRENSFITLSSTASWTALLHLAPDAERTEQHRR